MDHQREPGSVAQGEGAHQGFGVNGMVAAYQVHMERVLAYDFYKLYDVVSVSEMNGDFDHL